jgi:hypothetical protein
VVDARPVFNIQTPNYSLYNGDYGKDFAVPDRCVSGTVYAKDGDIITIADPANIPGGTSNRDNTERIRVSNAGIFYFDTADGRYKAGTMGGIIDYRNAGNDISKASKVIVQYLYGAPSIVVVFN